MNNQYVTLKIPRNLIEKIDMLVGDYGFTSRAEFVKEAIRKLLREYKEAPDVDV